MTYINYPNPAGLFYGYFSIDALGFVAFEPIE